MTGCLHHLVYHAKARYVFVFGLVSAFELPVLRNGVLDLLPSMLFLFLSLLTNSLPLPSSGYLNKILRCWVTCVPCWKQLPLIITNIDLFRLIIVNGIELLKLFCILNLMFQRNYLWFHADFYRRCGVYHRACCLYIWILMTKTALLLVRETFLHVA